MTNSVKIMKIALGICCLITLGKSFPVEDFHPSPGQPSHGRFAREINSYYGYQIPSMSLKLLIVELFWRK